VFGLLQHQSISMSDMLQHNLLHVRDLWFEELAIFLGSCVFFLALSWLLEAKAGLRFRIRAVTPKAPQMRREAFNSIRAFVIYNVAQIAMRAAFFTIGLVLVLDRPAIPLWLVVLSFPMVIVVHDAYFYWLHWSMHSPALFRLTHWEHHRSRVPTVFAAHSFSIAESVGHGFFPIFYVLVFPCTWPTLIFFYIVMIFHDVAIHSGIEMFPTALVTGKRFGWLCGAVHHDMHHAIGTTNYGLYFRFWDKLMKTEHPAFERIYAYIRSPENDGQAYKKLLGGARLGGDGRAGAVALESTPEPVIAS
jgi:sterol desaturase/sphingolipid hydroxylase (fatty acid hydroxylase superfamily)